MGRGVSLRFWGPGSTLASTPWSNSLIIGIYCAASARRHVRMFPSYKTISIWSSRPLAAIRDHSVDDSIITTDHVFRSQTHQTAGQDNTFNTFQQLCNRSHFNDMHKPRLWGEFGSNVFVWLNNCMWAATNVSFGICSRYLLWCVVKRDRVLNKE